MYGSNWYYPCSSQRGVRRVTHSFLLCALLVTTCGPSAVAQTAASPQETDDSAMQTVPLGSIMSDDLLKSAAATSALARQDEASLHYFDAARKYESILADAHKSTDSPDPTALHMMMAAANIDAARTRYYYGATLDKSLSMSEANRAAISDHLAAAQSEIALNLRKSSLKSLNLVGWSCDASKLRAQSYYLQGMLNNTPGDLDKSISEYKYVAQCEPASKPQVDSVTAYIAGVSANMAHSILSSKEIMKDISEASHLFGMKGDAVSLVVQRVYEMYQAQKTPPPIAVH